MVPIYTLKEGPNAYEVFSACLSTLTKSADVLVVSILTLYCDYLSSNHAVVYSFTGHTGQVA